VTRVLPVVLLGLVMASDALAQDWSFMANISSTMGVSGSRICIGEGSRPNDLGCPGYAPYVASNGNVGISTSSPNAKLEVNGTISATNFVGNGSGLTGLVATTDRITSGTSSIVVNMNGTISITTGGTPTVIISTNSFGGGLVRIGTGRKQLSLTTDPSGNDPMITNDGTSASHLFLRRSSTGGYLDLDPNLPGLSIYSPAGANRAVTINDTTGAIGWGWYGSDVAINGPFRALDEVRYALNIQGAPALPAATTNLVGGNLTLIGGAGATSSSGLANGGNVLLNGGKGYGTGRNGYVLIGTSVTTNVGIGLITPTTPLEVSGTVSATNFVGNGSGLTGIVGASADRIVSGTTSMVAISDTGYISVTTNGVTTGYFTPGGILVANGISVSTNQASFTTVYASGPISIPYSSVGVIDASNNSGGANYGFGGPKMGGLAAVKFGAGGPSSVMDTGISRLGPKVLAIGDSNAGNMSGALIAGNIGVGTASPTATLQVSGSFIVSSTGQTTTPTLYAGTNGNVGIGTAAPSVKLDINTGNDAYVVRGSYGALYNTSTYSIITGGSSSTGTLRTAPTFTMVPSSSLLGFAAGGINPGTPQSIDTYFYRQSAGVMRTPGSFLVDTAIGIGITPTVALEVSGTVSATRFVGNGSGLTGIVGASADRIVSGTTSMVAISDTGYISVTTNGVTTGYFTPGGVLVANGISVSTNQMSATTGFFSGKVGIGVSAPAQMLQVAGNMKLSGRIYGEAYLSSEGVGYGVTLDGATTGNLPAIKFYNRSGGGTLASFVNGSNVPVMTVMDAGNVGVGTVSPTATLQVSGSFIVSTTGQTTTPTLYVDAVSKTIRLGTTAGFALSEWPDSYHGSYYTGISPSLHVAGDIATTGQMVLQDGSYYASSHIWLDPRYALIEQRTKNLAGGSQTIRYMSVNSNQGGVLYDRWDYGTGYPNVSSAGGYFAYGINGATGGYLGIGIGIGGEVMRLNSQSLVGIGTSSPTTKLEVSGTISATRFIGDGSGLTGIAAGASDRITSGTVSAIAQQAAGAVQVSGSVNVSGTMKSDAVQLTDTGNMICDSSHYHTMRINPSTGYLEICRQ
jgi:hypothetical protein